jgi:uncharacterized protein with HEPN domain
MEQSMEQSLISSQNSEVTVITSKEMALFKERFSYIREDVQDNPYIAETLRVLPVGGYRSAIGSFWNAVVDDLRNKITFRSLNLFNKEMKPSKQITKYEDFQDYVNDEMLIDGAYKIGVIGWEAHKVLKQAKETRHIFDGHPRSSEPGALKALSMMEDCIKYVLSQEYPPQIIDIDEYINLMGTAEFDRNEFSISDAISDLPDIYKNELVNRLFSSYITDSCSSILRSNIEVVAPILWRVLPKDIMVQVSHRVDQEISKGNANATEYAFSFISLVGAKKYLTTKAKKYRLGPVVQRLLDNLDVFSIENECIDELNKYAGYIPRELLYDYVNGMVQTYVGHIGGSAQYSRTDFYANGAAVKIPQMFEKFDDESAHAFIEAIQTNQLLQSRIHNNAKLRRLRTLGEIVRQRASEKFEGKDFLEMLLDETKEKEFFGTLNKHRKPREE